MSITAAREFRQHVNRMSTLQAEVAPCVAHGVVDYEGLARLGSRSGFDFTAAEARQVLSAPGGLSEFENDLAASGQLACGHGRQAAAASAARLSSSAIMSVSGIGRANR